MAFGSFELAKLDEVVRQQKFCIVIVRIGAKRCLESRPGLSILRHFKE